MIDFPIITSPRILEPRDVSPLRINLLERFSVVITNHNIFPTTSGNFRSHDSHRRVDVGNDYLSPFYSISYTQNFYNIRKKIPSVEVPPVLIGLSNSEILPVIRPYLIYVGLYQ